MSTKDPLKFGESDFQLTRIVAVLVTLATAGIAVIGPLIDWANGNPLVTEVDSIRDVPADGASPGVTLTHGSAVTAEFADASAGMWLASLAPSLLFVAILGLVLWLLWGLLGDVERGEPFTMTNVGRMRGIAMAIIGGAFLLFVVDGVVNGYLTRQAFEDTTMLFANETHASDLLLPGVGFLIAALAEAFKRGVVLEAETEGLI